jgi:6-phosphogluconolactonase
MNALTTMSVNKCLRILFFATYCVAFIGCGGGSSGGGSTTTTGGGGGTGSGGASGPNEMVYVASGSNGQGQILAFPVAAGSGVLGTAKAINAPEFLYSMEADSAGKFLYASDFDSGAVRVYAIQSSTGALSEVAGSPFAPSTTPANGGPFALSPDGKFLFYSDSFGAISTFSISAGTLTASGAVVQNNGQPLSMVVDPAGKFLYASDHADYVIDAQMSVYSIASTGTLTEVPGSPFSFHGSSPNAEPAGIAIHPSGKFVYTGLTTNPTGVDGFTTNATTGALTLIPGAPFLQGLFTSNYMVMAPSGARLYATDPTQVIAFSIDASSGVLTKQSALSSSTGGTMQMVIDKAEKFLYSSNAPFKTVSSYPIDPTTGKLMNPVAYPAGEDPGALAVVQLQ